MAYQYSNLNNPGNIGYSSWTAAHGGVPSRATDTGHLIAAFPSLEAGYAAMAALAANRYSQGNVTLNQLVAGPGGWTPGNYEAAANIARYMGIAPTADLNLNDSQSMASFQRALTRQETGTYDQWDNYASANPVAAASPVKASPTIQPSGPSAVASPNNAVTVYARGISPPATSQPSVASLEAATPAAAFAPLTPALPAATPAEAAATAQATGQSIPAAPAQKWTTHDIGAAVQAALPQGQFGFNIPTSLAIKSAIPDYVPSQYVPQIVSSMSPSDWSSPPVASPVSSAAIQSGINPNPYTTAAPPVYSGFTPPSAPSPAMGAAAASGLQDYQLPASQPAAPYAGPAYAYASQAPTPPTAVQPIAAPSGPVIHAPQPGGILAPIMHIASALFGGSAGGGPGIGFGGPGGGPGAQGGMPGGSFGNFGSNYSGGTYNVNGGSYGLPGAMGPDQAAGGGWSSGSW